MNKVTSSHHKLPSDKPAIWIVFGASGDLVKRKILPAFYALFRRGNIHKHSKIIGISRKELDFVQFTRQSLATFSKEEQPESDLISFCKMIEHLAIDIEDESAYKMLAQKIEALHETISTHERLFYFSTPPELFSVLIKNLAKVSLLTQRGDIVPKILIEKPFGKDFESAKLLNDLCLSVATEEQIYRIDHYLGKEAIQQLPFLRLNNPWFEQVLNKNHVEYAQITISESIGFEGRVEHYEKTGHTKDMLQNHMLQLLALSTMELPKDFSLIPQAKQAVLSELRPIEVHAPLVQAIKGQYQSGHIHGQQVSGYIDEKGVPKESKTETYIAVKAHIDNERWMGVPFYLRSGKRLSAKVAEIVFHLKNHGSFSKDKSSTIRIEIQPNASLSVSIKTGQMHFNEAIHNQSVCALLFTQAAQEAYEYILFGALKGQKHLFVSGIEALLCWRWIEPLLSASHIPLALYPAGSQNPQEASNLLEDGHFFSLF